MMVFSRKQFRVSDRGVSAIILVEGETLWDFTVTFLTWAALHRAKAAAHASTFSLIIISLASPQISLVVKINHDILPANTRELGNEKDWFRFFLFGKMSVILLHTDLKLVFSGIMRVVQC